MAPRGLIKATAIYNNIEARKDWQTIARNAEAAGRGDLVQRHAPPQDAGWRKIDKAIDKLRAELDKGNATENQP